MGGKETWDIIIGVFSDDAGLLGMEDSEFYSIYVGWGIPWRVEGRTNLGWHCCEEASCASKTAISREHFQRSILYFKILLYYKLLFS